MRTGHPLPYESISSGVESLDALINAIPIGDNVVWEIDAGTSYDLFIRSFIARSFRDSQKVIYVSFNRSPQTVLGGLERIISPEHFTLIDCFTSGKGKNDSTFVKFYEKAQPATVVRIEAPRDIDRFTATLNDIEDKLPPGARYVFDSLTGMQDLWGDENQTHRFFTYMCPRLYDLGTVAYWVLEKEAHSQKFKANLRHITQVVFDLYKRKNALFIKAIKLEGRQNRDAFAPHQYEVRDGGEIVISLPRKEPTTEVGGRIREARTRLGMSQKELAERVSVTPSFLSQLESNQVSPSLPTFLQICRALGINPGLFLEAGSDAASPWLVRRQAMFARPPVREDIARVYDLAAGKKLSARIVVLPRDAAMNRHFFYHKDEELVFVLEGKLTVTIDGKEELVASGDAISLKDSFPSQWKNEGGDEAKLLVVW